MNGLLISAIIITVLYTVVKFFQMRFIDKENKPLKELISDSCIVFLVTFAGMFATEQLGSIDGFSHAFGLQSSSESSQVKAFTGKANF